MNTYINSVQVDTRAEYFTTSGVYNGSPQPPRLKDVAAANALYGDLRAVGESDDDFLSRMNAPATRPYTVKWEAGTYANYTNKSGTNVIDDTGYQEIVAGVHYYRIIDNATGSVISYKHAFTIAQDTIQKKSSNITGGGDTPRFVWDEISYNVIWSGVANPTRNFRSPTFTGTISELMTKNGDSFGSSNVFSGSILLTISDAEHNRIDENNFDFSSAESIAVNYTALATAYVKVNSGNPTYYGAVQQALKATESGASSGTTVVAMPSFEYNGTNYYAGTQGSGVHYDHVIDADSTVGVNVTLRIPNGIDDNTSDYDKSSGHTGLFYVPGTDPATGKGHEDLKSDDSAYYNKEYDVNVVTLADNTILTNKGTIIIDAVVSGGGSAATYSSIVFGAYGRLTMGENAQLINNTANSKINCYGFIDEVSEDNGSKIDASNGEVLGVLSIVEHRTGYVFMGMANPDSDIISESVGISALIYNKDPKPYSPTLTTFPFHRFFIQSVGVEMTVQSKATFKAVTNLYANSSQNETVIDFAGGSASAVFNVSGNSYVVCKYNNSQDATQRKFDIDVYGSSTFTPMTLVLTTQKEAAGGLATGTIIIDMKTAGTLFPISHYFDIDFKKNGNSEAIVNMTGQDIKLLPGGKLTIDPGVTVNAGKIAVYKDNSLLNGDTSIAGVKGRIIQNLDYPDTFNDTGGELIVNGTLNAGYLGGKITSTSPTAKVRVSAATSLISPELMTTTNAELAITVFGYTLTQAYYAATYSSDAASTLTLDPCLIYDSNTTAKNGVFNVGTTYYSAKYGDSIAWLDSSITMTYDLGYDNQVVVENVTAQPGGGIAAFYKPSYSGHIFKGWYTDTTYQTLVDDPSTIKHSTTLYALWEEVPTYTITYDANYPDDAGFADAVFSGGSPEAPEGVFTDVHMNCNWNNNYDRPYYLLGWSAENDGTVDESFNIEGETTLYAVWAKKVQLTVDYNCGTGTGQNTVLGYTNKVVWVARGGTYTLSGVSSGDYDLTNKWYFAGVTTDNCSVSGTTITIGTDEAITTATATVKWAAKYEFKVEVSNATITLNYGGSTYSVSSGSKSYYAMPNEIVSASVSYSQSNSRKAGVVAYSSTSYGSLSEKSSFTAEITGDKAQKLYASSEGTCFTPDTLITLADGTQKRVEDLTTDDVLLVFNHLTGNFEARKLFFTAHENDQPTWHRVITLEFSDGSVVRIVTDHGFFDLTLNKYVYIDETNVAEYIGHKFYSAKFVDGAVVSEEVILVNSYITEEFIKVYSPVSEGTFNCFADSILTITPLFDFSEGFANIFEYGEGMKYDEDQMAKDIEEYGLYTYEEFAEYYTYEQFVNTGTAYFKIAVGKGYMTHEEVVEIAKYLRGSGMLK